MFVNHFYWTASLERIGGFFLHLLHAEGNLFYFFWTENPEMPSFPVPNKALQRKVEAWQEMTGVDKKHEVERFDTRGELCERLFQLRLMLGFWGKIPNL